MLKLSQALLSELALLIVLAPFAVTDIRAAAAESIYTSDASMWGTSHARASVPGRLGEELARHTIRRGCWTRLLSPTQAWLARHGILSPDEALPGEGIEAPSPLWEGLVRSLAFLERGRAGFRGRRPHINIGEIRGALDAVRDAATNEPGKRMILGVDSMVALGALAKGRSSSQGLNRELERGLGWIIGGDLLVLVFWISTHFNPSDDGTRHRPIRGPDMPSPPWVAAVLENNFGIIDSIVNDNIAVLGEAPLEALASSISQRRRERFKEGEK